MGVNSTEFITARHQEFIHQSQCQVGASSLWLLMPGDQPPRQMQSRSTDSFWRLQNPMHMEPTVTSITFVNSRSTSLQRLESKNDIHSKNTRYDRSLRMFPCYDSSLNVGNFSINRALGDPNVARFGLYLPSLSILSYGLLLITHEMLHSSVFRMMF